MGASDLDNLVQPGQVLAGKYRIDRVLGKGGMGVVVSAHHIQLDEKVAIKFLLPAAVGKPELMARFEREARAAVKIKSEHIARVLDVGVLDTGAPYMVMEFLEGQDLAQKIAREGPVPYQQAADFLLQACEAIVEAHALGIVHRDLKPANLFVVRRADGLDSVKVLDFGISKSTGLGGSGGGDMTQTQSMLGSPYYMSPEQMQSARNVDARTDIWAIGCILYESVMGRVPFEAESLPELVLKIVGQAPPSMRVARPDVDSGFEQVVMRCLEKDRERRYPHIGELAAALVRFAPERARASADRILRVVHASGLGLNQRPSSPNLAVPGPGTLPMQAVTLSPANPPNAQSGANTGPSITAVQAATSPPPGTPPPQAGSQPRLGGTNDGASWGQTGSSIPKTSPVAMIGALFAAVVVIGGGVGGLLYAKGHFFTNAGGADAATSAPVPLLSATASSAPSAEPLAVPSVVPSAEPVVVPVHDAAAPVVEPARPVTPPAPVPVPAPQPVSQPVPQPLPQPKPATSGRPADCATSPQYIDARGNKVFRKECF